MGRQGSQRKPLTQEETGHPAKRWGRSGRGAGGEGSSKPEGGSFAKEGEIKCVDHGDGGGLPTGCGSKRVGCW